MNDFALARFLRGARLSAPMGLSYIPLAFSFGLLAVQSGMPPWIACLMSAIVFAGASQFASIAMLRAASSTPEIIVATLFINLRHIIYNLALLPRLGIRSLAARVMVGSITTDEAFAFGSLAEDPGIRTQAGMLGLSGTLWLCWNGGTLAGAFLSPDLPPAIAAAVGVLLYGMFIGLLVPALRKLPRALIVTAMAVIVHTLARQWIAPGWAMVAAIVVGASMGPLFDIGGGEEADAR